MAHSNTATQRKYKVEVDMKWCKGCGICIAFCPKKVLEAEGLDKKPKVVDPGLCIGCKMCEVRCPDFAIWVELEEA